MSKTKEYPDHDVSTDVTKNNKRKKDFGNRKTTKMKQNSKSRSDRNSGPYHEASVLFNKLLVLSETKQKVKEKKFYQSFDNSIPVSGLKSIVFNTKTVSSIDNSSGPNSITTTTEMICSKSTYATLCQTIQSKPLIDTLLDYQFFPPSTESKDKKKKISLRHILMKKCKNTGLLYILLHELLFSKFQKIRGGGGLKRIILQHEKNFRRLQKSLNLTFDEIQTEKKNSKINGTGISFPRYVRVNTIKTSIDEVVSILINDIDSKDDQADIITERNISSSESDVENKFKFTDNNKIYLDAHVPDLLVLPPEIMKSDSAQFYSHSLVQDGKIIFQDKSSCFSALALVHALPEMAGVDHITTTNMICGDILDACAAPGNKTSHLAALLTEQFRKRGKQEQSKNEKGKSWPKIIALDRDKKRFEILKSRAEHLVSSPSKSGKMSKYVKVQPVQSDFLQTSPTDPQFKNLTAILLDPSCSGSGIINSPDRQQCSGKTKNKQDQEQRIQSLSRFQLTCLKHAMSFPQVDRIVYSTCSIHNEENEGVVAAALGITPNSKKIIINDENDNSHEKFEKKLDNENGEWELISPVSLAQWIRRGIPVYGLSDQQSKCLIRCNAEDDETNGFFVACFQRKQCNNHVPSPGDSYLNNKVGKAGCTESIQDKKISLPIYNGEYKNISIEREEKSDKDIKRECGTIQKTSKLHGKKLKASLWKKRQREKKEQRLKNKKSKLNGN